jgi:aldehyde:ferredoxin oxidoreductase
MHGWCGRILRVDLSRGKITTEALDPAAAGIASGPGGSGFITCVGKSTRPATPAGRTTSSSRRPGR